MPPGKHMALSDTPEDSLPDLIETAKAQIRPKGEHPFCAIKQQFDFQEIRMRGLAKNTLQDPRPDGFVEPFPGPTSVTRDRMSNGLA